MTNEEKSLLFKDLCARFPYGVIVKVFDKEYGDFDAYIENIGRSYVETNAIEELDYNPSVFYKIEDVKPYLRPLESQTDEEMEERGECVGDVMRMDYYYSHHLDCHQLIRRGLALKAPEDMYKL